MSRLVESNEPHLACGGGLSRREFVRLMAQLSARAGVSALTGCNGDSDVGPPLKIAYLPITKPLNQARSLLSSLSDP